MLRYSSSPIGNCKHVLFPKPERQIQFLVSYDHNSPETIRGLALVLTMPPMRAGRLRHELISEEAARRDGALSHHADPVHVVGTSLVHAMPMDAGRLVAKVVVDVDDEGVTDVDHDHRRGPLLVDGDDGAKETIWCLYAPADGPVEVNDGCGRGIGKGHKYQEDDLKHPPAAGLTGDSCTVTCGTKEKESPKLGWICKQNDVGMKSSSQINAGFFDSK
jgi:hypothetical protein